MKVHPELLNNSLFMRYYQRWQEDPSSVVFVPISEFFLTHDMTDEALKVAQQGLKIHHDLISAHLAMAKILIKKNDFDGAKSELEFILAKIPKHGDAVKLLMTIEPRKQQTVDLRPSRDENKNVVEVTTESFVKQVFETEEEQEEITEAERLEPQQEEKFEMPIHLQTLTMAKILSSQGHTAKARQIYRTILNREPTCQDAIFALNSLDKEKKQ